MALSIIELCERWLIRLMVTMWIEFIKLCLFIVPRYSYWTLITLILAFIWILCFVQPTIVCRVVPIGRDIQGLKRNGWKTSSRTRWLLSARLTSELHRLGFPNWVGLNCLLYPDHLYYHQYTVVIVVYQMTLTKLVPLNLVHYLSLGQHTNVTVG